MRVAIVGDVGVDQYVNLGLTKPGGIAFNFAVNVIDAGENASLISVIGNDEKGNMLKSLLQSVALYSSQIETIDGETPEQKIILRETGERKFVGYTQGVLKKWRLKQKNLDFISAHDAIFVPLSDGMEHIFNSIANLKTAAKKITDFSQDYEFADFDKENNIIKKYCRYFDINFIGGTKKQIPLLTSLSKEYPNKVFVLTLGKEGSIAIVNGEQTMQAAKNIEKIIDTTGCGDAFQAAFLCSYFKSKNISRALEKATKQAAKISQHIGSTDLYFTSDGGIV